MEVYSRLQQDTRDVYEGFAAGVNRYLAQHREAFAGWVADPFTGYDVAALYVSRASAGQTRRWISRLTGAPDAPLLDIEHDDTAIAGDPLEAGSSAWALVPSRTTSGAAILLRNPHLSWDAGYWEAHAVVPGRLDFYGDFRIGAPLGIVGGFNPSLGFATTNNAVDNGQVYALEVDPGNLDHYLLDGASVPLGRELVTRRFRNGDGYGFETRERVFTDLGPVIHRDHGRIYILRTPEDGEFRGGEQFLRMMQATTLDEWTAAMRLRAFPRSNFTYADAEGNVFYLWNAAMPVFPHPYDDTRAVPVTRRDQLWSTMHALDELPQVLNPPGGYVRNENDGPWLTNLQAPLDPADYPVYFEAQGFRLRSQHAALLVGTDERLSLEEVVRRKHSYRMLLADRVKSDLLAGTRRALDEGTLDIDTVGATALGRCCMNRHWPARCQPTGFLPADAIRRWSAEGGHPIQDLTAEDDLTPLPGWAPGAKTIADDGLVSEERVLHPALTMVSDACFRRARHDPKSSLVFHRDGIPVRHLYSISICKYNIYTIGILCIPSCCPTYILGSGRLAVTGRLAITLSNGSPSSVSVPRGHHRRRADHDRRVRPPASTVRAKIGCPSTDDAAGTHPTQPPTLRTPTRPVTEPPRARMTA